MGNFNYNHDGFCTYAPIYLYQHPDYCNFNLILVTLIMLSGYGLLLLANRMQMQKEQRNRNENDHPITVLPPILTHPKFTPAILRPYKNYGQFQ
ncbi:hypothetical protein KEM48_012500 [Puccinia striiformis f. sp. tritici PST-130]|uniref:Uncharacterized protein n=2 Tax=Puccinia striiformis TaxID=27350 RepID=A0A0L0VG03_9BASI|nr:hypothetical protein KEM48_012500 [Puccinia striiformis f. sp. tritici PST-130]KNE98126.1 hypothetical protein PSTG_08589 [Puccinia striiformis f. sp. tritici PST-78]